MSKQRRRIEGFRLLLFDIQLDVDNWKRIVEYIETKRKYDPTILRTVLIQTYTLMRDINRQKGCKPVFARDSIFYDVTETPDDGHHVLTIVKALKALVSNWNKIKSEVETETKVREPGKCFWEFIIRAEKVMFQLMTKEIPNPSTQKLQQPANASIKRECRQNTELSVGKNSINTESDHFGEKQKERQVDEELNHLRWQLREIKLENDRLNDRLDTLQKSPQKLEDLSEVEKQLTDKEVEIQELKADKETLLTRLSKLAADRLTTNNPNITDLSDKFRPTKLADVYTQIYDDEWTDAFESLIKTGPTEKEVIVTLRDRLLDAFDFCQDRRQEIFDSMIKSIKRESKNQRGSAEVEYDSETVENKVRRLIKDLSQIILPIVRREFISSVWNETMPAEMKLYLKKCLLVTWMMTVQDPPMAFAQPADDTDTTVTLDTTMYRHYMTAGTILDYTLWPCLLLHEHGPVVAKGVAEAKAKSKAEKHVSVIVIG